MPTTIIEDKLAAFVVAIADFATAASGRYYPYGEVPEDTQWPFATYRQIAGDRMTHLRGVGGTSHSTIEIGCHGHSYGDAKTLANTIKLALDAFFQGDMGGIKVQRCTTSHTRDFGAADTDLKPLHGDAVAQPCTTFDVTIWFYEG